jgi:hypothetical protein
VKPSELRSLHDVDRWLRNYVEWSDEHSRDMAAAALAVLEAVPVRALKTVRVEPRQPPKDKMLRGGVWVPGRIR